MTSSRTGAIVVELVGPAGGGKSTVADVLRAREGAVRASIWGLPARWLLASAVALLPTLLRLTLAARALRGAEIKQMIRVAALRRLLSRRVVDGRRLVVLDEGPVFALSWLRVFGGARLIGSVTYDAWMRRTLAEWASLVAVVAVVDAPDRVLAQRIRSRPKPHMVKDQSDQEIAAFAARFRSAFATMIPALLGHNGTTQLTLQADRESPEDLAARIVHAVEALRA